MSVSSALNSAISGLTATARAADVVSSNLANVLTPGYGVRKLELETLGHGRLGVGITGVTRAVDEGIIADRRLAGSELAFANTRAQFLAALDRAVGTPDQTSSLSGRLSAFEAALTSASSHPENQTSLQTAVVRAGELVAKLNSASLEIQDSRTEADSEIGRAIESVNTLLESIQEVNKQIVTHAKDDLHSAALFDQRQALVNQLSEFIPVRQLPRDNGEIALMTPGGAILLDGSAAKLEFTTTNVVAPHMTLGNGLLSGLTINGISIPLSGNNSPINGGKLAALFSIRDDVGVDAQAQLDAIARDLIERFQQPAIDATRAPGDPGLLTDNGTAFDPLNEIGVASRIALNTAVDPDQGGAAWRLRDGLGAVSPGPGGNGVILEALRAAMTQSTSLSNASLGVTARSASGHVAAFTSNLGQNRITFDQAVAFASTRESQLTALELQNTVDSDAEMQKLLLIEQAYAANARMIQTVDEMIQALLRI